MNAHQKSNAFAASQFVLFGAFAIVYFAAPGVLLFSSPKIAGDIVVIAGLVLMAAAFVSLREVIQVQPEPKAGGHLVTSGVYRRLRHPIYTGIVLILIGLFVREPGAFVAVAAVVIVVFLVVKSRFEERLLRERYPDYAEYMKRSWGVLPWGPS